MPENDAVLYWIYIEYLFTLAVRAYSRWTSIKEFHSPPKWISFKMIKFFSKDTGSTTRKLLALLAHTLFYFTFICIILLCRHFEFKMQFCYMEIILVHFAVSYEKLCSKRLICLDKLRLDAWINENTGGPKWRRCVFFPDLCLCEMKSWWVIPWASLQLQGTSLNMFC